jgi:hypothetical protein
MIRDPQIANGIKGPAGPAGPAGATGPAGPTNAATRTELGAVYGNVPRTIEEEYYTNFSPTQTISWNGTVLTSSTAMSAYFPNNLDGIVVGAYMQITVSDNIDYRVWDVLVTAQTSNSITCTDLYGPTPSFTASPATGINTLKFDINSVSNANLSIGFQSGATSPTQYTSKNTAVGFKTLNNAIDGDSTAVGFKALQTATGWSNTAVGSESLKQTTSYGSTAIGAFSLGGQTSGSRNTALGQLTGTSVTTGIQNTILGNQAGTSLTTGNNNTIIGNGANAASATTNNTITLGNSSIATLRCQVTTITALSDERDKTNIEDNELGLDFINALRTRKFRYNCREWYEEEVLDENGTPIKNEDGTIKTVILPNDGSRAAEQWTEGFVAQELQSVVSEHDASWLNIVDETNPEKLEAATHKVVIPLVKAVQELSEMVATLQEQIKELSK